MCCFYRHTDEMVFYLVFQVRGLFLTLAHALPEITGSK